MKRDIVKPLFQEISHVIDNTRLKVAYQANSALVMLYWQIGQRINQDVLKHERAEYGEQIIRQLAKQLKTHYGSGFEATLLFRMVRFVKIYPEPKIVATLSQLLSWSHFRELISIEDTLKRDFYTEMCHIENWSVRLLRQKIDGMLYERTAITKKPDKIIKAELIKLKQEDLMYASDELV